MTSHFHRNSDKVLCVSKSQSQLPNTANSLSNQLRSACEDGQPIVSSDQCNTCICFAGQIYCTNIPCQEQDCVNGVDLPQPDACNKCICQGGKVICSNMICIPGPECTDNQLVYRLDECNECYCFEGRLECSDLVCIRGSKCVQGQVIPKPDSCNACKCVEGHILCTNYQCPIPNSKNALRPGKSTTELRTLDECQEGDVIAPPPPPNDSNTCYCMDSRILCTRNNCKGSDPEIKGRLREPDEQTDLKFINKLTKNYEKLPTKLLHTHAYNGFHQEIKVHANHLPKDATKILKVLATSLDNSALASFSQRLLTSSNSLSNNHDSKILLDNQVVLTKLLGEENVLTSQSSKLITSGSLSNETILVIPNTEPFDDLNSHSVLPLSKHETIWKTVSSPDNNQKFNPRSSQEEKLNVYYYDNPPSIFAPIDQNNVIRNPSKFSRPGFSHILPTNPTRNIVEIPNTNTQSIYPASNPKPININDGKISYTPFSHDNKQFKPIPSGIVPKHDELPRLRPYQLTKPGNNQIFNYTSSTPIFRPGKFIVIPNNNGGQQNPSQSQFIPNLSNYYPNYVKPQQIQLKPNQNHTLNNKGIQHPPLFPNNPNQPIVAANQYKQPQFGLKPGQGSVTPLNNKGNQTDQQFKVFPPSFQITPLINLPNQNKRICTITNEVSKEISSKNQDFSSISVENPTYPKDSLQKLPQSQFISSPNQHTLGALDEGGSADGFQYPSNFAETFLHPKQNMHKPPSSLFGSTFHKQLPRMYPSNSAGNPTHPKNLINPNHNKQTPGMLDDRVSPDGFKFSSNSAENPLHPKDNLHYLINSQLGPAQNQHLPGVSSRGSAGGLQYPTNSFGNPTHLKDNLHNSPQSQFLPSHNQYTSGVFDDGGFQYPSNSAENRTNTKDNLHILPHSQFLPNQNQHKQNLHKQPNSSFGPTQNQRLPGMFDGRGSADGFQYPSRSTENSLQPKDNQHNPLHPQFSTTQNQHTPEVFDDRGSADDFHYPSNFAENSTHPTNNPKTTLESKFKQPENQPEPSSLNDGYNNNNHIRLWMHLDHDQYKPSSFENLLNGVHNIPWSFSGNHNKDSDTVTSVLEPRFSHYYNQYKPSSFDHLFNGIHQIHWSVPNQDNNANFGSDAEITTPRFGFKPKQDQYRPSMVKNPSIYNQNENTDLTDLDNNQLQIEEDVSTPSKDLTYSDSIQNNLLPELKPDSNPDSLLTTDDGKIPEYYDQLYPSFKAVKKLSDLPIDDSVYNVGSMDQLGLLPILFPGIAKIINYEPSQDQDDVSPVEHHEGQRIIPLSKPNKFKFKQLPENDNGILNWLKGKLNKLVPKKYTDTKNDIDITKIFKLLYKLTSPKLKHTTALQNIPFCGFDAAVIENIMNYFKEDTLTTTLTPRSDSTHSYENRYRSVPTIPEPSRPQAPSLKYPEVHIILHQPNDEDDVDLPPYIESDGETNLAAYMDSEDTSTSTFPKMFNPRFRHRPKDQKEECGHETQWISNCHGCSCYFGQAMCFRLPDCELRPLGEPMTCKPYSHFKMGCYTCECNGDGVAECDATDCYTKPSEKSRELTESPIFDEFFDGKKTNEILQYYNFYKKLPKDCPKQDLQTQFPTCAGGTSWVSRCHKCECNESGKRECINIDDCKLDVDSYGKPGRCKPNSKFYPKTNSMPCVECSCNDEGIPYCPAADYKKQ